MGMGLPEECWIEWVMTPLQAESSAVAVMFWRFSSGLEAIQGLFNTIMVRATIAWLPLWRNAPKKHGLTCLAVTQVLSELTRKEMSPRLLSQLAGSEVGPL